VRVPAAEIRDVEVVADDLLGGALRTYVLAVLVLAADRPGPAPVELGRDGQWVGRLIR